MTDNIQLNEGLSGDVSAADDIGGVKHQRMKLEHGITGVVTDTSKADPLPIFSDNGTVKFLSDFAQSGNAEITLSGAAQSNAHYEIDWIGWSFSAPPITNPSLIVTIGGTVVWSKTISEVGFDGVVFDPPLYKESKTNNEDIVFTLEAGGAAVTGKLQTRYYYK